MSFGGGFGGFGQNNNTQQSAFGSGGGFGANNPPATTGFGATANTGFGATNTGGGGLFGSGGTGTTGGFGAGGGFGATNNNAFGAAKPSAFGTAASSGGMFGGGGTATAGSSGFGGFGATNTTSSPFGGGNTTSGGGLFGQNKPAFGGTATPAASNPFGGAATSSPFGGGNTGAFGAPQSTALTTTGAGECQGTGNVQFQPFVEKEPNSSSNQQNSFQSICFQQPYQKFSPEELRLVDYAQGRRYGNSNNQPGAFGASNFGGFGATQPASTGFGAPAASNTNVFGGGAASTGFGASQPASTGFGSTATTGGLFGAKPATGGLFGAQPAAQPSGGLFGAQPAAQPAGGLFGAQPAAQNTGGGLFGGNNAAKTPFSFGTSQPAAANTGFGSTATTGGFGSGGGLFGSTNTQQPAATGFGAAQQPAASTGFGFGAANTQQTGGGLFGSTAAKPAGGLFGAAPAATNTGGGLFGNTQQPASNNLFGGSANTQNSGGLFGAKPAATAGGMFGNTSQQNTTGGGGLFGGGFGNNNQTQQSNTGGGMFGAANNQQKPGGLFGSTGTQQQGGSSMFGNTATQQQSGGMFGSSLGQPQQQAPQQQGSSFLGCNNSIFNPAAQNQQNQNGQSLTASLNDNTAFSGSSSIFAPLANNQVNNPGPIATPLSSNVKTRKSAALPLYKLNSASTARLSTPQKRTGFGFSYSNYNTPGSASSTSSTPGFGGSMVGAGSFGRTLNKSMSTSSLRRSFNTEDSILAPGAFSASPNARHYGSTGSVKKLTISRGLRHDLFAPPTPQSQPAAPPAIKKRVSFGADVNGNSSASGSGSSSPLKQVYNNGGSSDPSADTNENSQTSSSGAPEMSEVSISNNQLTIVREEEITPFAAESKTSQTPKEPGAYWMKPSKEEIGKMNREQRKKVMDFTVGRHGVGQIRFETPADLSAIDLDEIPDGIVVLTKRSATVYQDAAQKPAEGKGLNLPSTIQLEDSWPRKKDAGSARGYQKHIERLKKVDGTTYLDYDKDSGIWTFHVEHFTTYALEDEDDDMEDEFGQSTLSAPPDTPAPNSATLKSARMDESFASQSQMTYTESDPEDTFEFRKKKVLPGAFDDQELFEDESGDGENDEQNQESFLDERSAGSQSESGVDEPMDQDDENQDDESVSIADEEMAGSYLDADDTAELVDSQDGDESVHGTMETPGAVLRARMRALKSAETPSKKNFSAGDDWANTLQATISPQKQNRALLKSMMDVDGNRPDSEPTPMPKRVVSDGRGFATSIDLMNSLFGQTRSPVKAKVPAKPKGFEWPYAKRPKTGDHDMSDMSDTDRAFHDSMKPQWGPDGTLVYAAPPNVKPFGRSSRRAREREGLLTVQKKGVVSEHRDVCFAKFSNEASAALLRKQKDMSIIDNSTGVPQAHLPRGFTFSDFFDESTATNPAASHEKLVWQLASILFDEVSIPEDLEEIPNIEERLRKDKLSAFWQKLVDDASSKGAALATSDEEKAIASLSAHRVPDACGHLVNARDFHLATLVALIGSKDSTRKGIRQQLSDWHKTQMLSEFSQPVRAVYEMLAGNVCVCTGSKDLNNRMDSFIISKRFGLDWRQAFGLRLWYGILSSEPLDAAVEAFAGDLSQDKETARPDAWYIEQKVPVLWNDENREEREDLLWGLLKLYTFNDSDIEDVLRPENSQLSPLDTRLSWQLSRALTSSGRARYTDDDSQKADQTTLSFAAQLISEDSWLDAMFVLLHLSSDHAREKSIQDHLAHNAGLIGAEDSHSFTTLTHTLKIPTEWIWEAKALYMRSVERNPSGEVECLIKAGSYNEAHRTFAREVAPKAIVELDYDILRTLLHGFQGKEGTIAEWHLGGEIYQDFLELLHNDKKGAPIDDLVLERLLSGLPAVVQESRHPSFMETVAVETISGEVAKTVIAIGKKGDKSNLSKILRLPLTEDKYLKHTVELSLEYYRGVMASAR
ncbi:related to Nup98-Nup96 precursor [Rhynchosporium graminicola]|uniref:Related to Nup98-Nup96 n=1 Tax=Rhynchosporium graminicola TaxID=2792576 RepID=A0A1E1K8U5_9HELO|nr:related to Nup98-Nup96 precursor [Rhynchosporium commune]